MTIYPPSNLADDKTNATGITDDHPGHHNLLADAINAVVLELGSGPKGAAADLTQRLLADFITTKGGGKESVATVTASGATTAIDLANGNIFVATLAASTAFVFNGATAGKGCSFTVLFTQDGAGGHAVTLPGSVVWAGGFAPVLGTTPGAVTIASFMSIDGGATWIGFGSTLPTNIALGYVLLDSSTLVAAAQLGAGAADQTKFLRGDRTWQTIPADYFNWSMEGTVYVKTGTKRLYVEGNRTILGVRASVGTAPTGSSLVVDVRKNGTSIFNVTPANRPTIAAASNTSGPDTSMDVTTLAQGDYLTVDVVSPLPSGLPGADLVVQVRLLGAQ